MRTSPGWSGSLPATGWSSSSPKWRAKATWSARLMSWSRKKITLCFSSSARISPMRSASRAASPMFTLRISGADRAGQRLDLDRRQPRGARNMPRRAGLRYLSRYGHALSSCWPAALPGRRLLATGYLRRAPQSPHPWRGTAPPTDPERGPGNRRGGRRAFPCIRGYPRGCSSSADSLSAVARAISVGVSASWVRRQRSACWSRHRPETARRGGIRERHGNFGSWC